MLRGLNKLKGGTVERWKSRTVERLGRKTVEGAQNVER